MEKVQLRERKQSRPRNRIRKDLNSIVILLAILATAKFLVFLLIYLHSDIPRAGFLEELGTKWDSGYYVRIAELGYRTASKPGGDDAYAFSPLLPALIFVARFVTGSYWSAGLFVTNIFSFLFPIALFKLSNFRAALIAELFPIYLVFSTLNYADIITLFFLALSLFFLLKRDNHLLSGVALGFAVLNSYIMIFVLPIFAAWIILTKGSGSVTKRDILSRLSNLVRFIIPVAIAGLAIGAFFLIETGSLWTFFSVEKTQGWDVAWVTPLQQVRFLLGGWFTSMHWMVMGVYLPPSYWLARNFAFEVFYMVGVILLLRSRILEKWFLAALALSVITPLFFLDGVAAVSVPRLLLPAFTIFFGYSESLLKKNRVIVAYSILCLAIAPVIALIQLDALFS